MSSNLVEIIKDGFSIEVIKDEDLGIAFSSLKIALKSYFSTYQCFKINLNIVSQDNTDQDVVDYHHNNRYCELCTETLIHFQHFFELACKKILKDEHPLLSDVALTKPVVLHKLLNNQELSGEETNSLRSIEFSEAILRLDELIKHNQMSNCANLQFIRDKKETLIQINALRNRVWHRGVYVLRYQSLDKFICGYVLPLLNDFLQLNEFKGNDCLWKYKALDCKLDPITELVAAYSSKTFDIKKVAFIKELGRAAYSNPLWNRSASTKKTIDGFSKFFDRKHIDRAMRISKAEASQDFASVLSCPVCGVKSLVLYTETDVEYGNEEEEYSGYAYTDRVVCECCQLTLYSGFDNAIKYGFSNIDDFWHYTEI
ncbi:hypothetical protein [Aeromonas veronii]|uniref:hypothetical protein n=1 Tax=Aeromonas veronii TaxID=654 RepID=UPI003BA2C58E